MYPPTHPPTLQFDDETIVSKLSTNFTFHASIATFYAVRQSNILIQQTTPKHYPSFWKVVCGIHNNFTITIYSIQNGGLHNWPRGVGSRLVVQQVKLNLCSVSI
jgi:hypothetical protein